MKNWKNELRAALTPPPPARKGEFLEKINPPGIPFYKLLIVQAGYIRKSAWILSALIFGRAVLRLRVLPGEGIWAISALTPLLALTIVAESGRSQLYKMEELEAATRFSLKSVTLSRLCVLGLGNGAVLAALLPAGLRAGEEFVPRGLYILTPYLLSAFAGLWIVRKIPGREGLSACAGAGVSISVFLSIFHESLRGAELVKFWGISAAVLLAANLFQRVKIIDEKEKFVWNLL